MHSGVSDGTVQRGGNGVIYSGEAGTPASMFCGVADRVWDRQQQQRPT